jgi:hypothetical protein
MQKSWHTRESHDIHAEHTQEENLNVYVIEGIRASNNGERRAEGISRYRTLRHLTKRQGKLRLVRIKASKPLRWLVRHNQLKHNPRLQAKVSPTGLS